VYTRVRRRVSSVDVDPSQEHLSRVGVRDLRTSVAAIVRRAAQGERIVVTVDGIPTAMIGPIVPDGDGVTFEDLVAAGLVQPPGRLDHPDAPDPVSIPVDARTSRVLDELRGG
jgi:antitoxin (DNA-binding transcriptional repressor) of toxin-antitoxin stability system